jgi:hypothetical protein
LIEAYETAKDPEFQENVKEKITNAAVATKEGAVKVLVVSS